MSMDGRYSARRQEPVRIYSWKVQRIAGDRGTRFRSYGVVSVGAESCSAMRLVRAM